jgi:hypothetical protein
MKPEEKTKMLKYHKALDFLHKKEADAIRAIVDTIKHEVNKPDAAAIKSFHDLPFLMLSPKFFKIVKEDAEGVILDEEVKDEFLHLLGE